MKELSLREAMRYAIGGGVFLVTLAGTRGREFFEDASVESLGGAVLVVGLAFLAGALLYSMHRAVVYPILYVVQLKLLSSDASQVGYRHTWREPVSAAEFEWDARRRRNPVVQITEWADQVHLLYTASQAIVCALLVDIFLPGGLSVEVHGDVDSVAALFVVFAAFLFAAAVWSHRRYLVYEGRLLVNAEKAHDANAAEQDAAGDVRTASRPGRN